MTPFHYLVGGMRLESELELHPLHAVPSGPRADVTVSVGTFPSSLGADAIVRPRYQLTPQRFLLDVPGVARFLAEEGSAITIEPVDSAPPSAISLFLLGSALGAVAHQRGLLPLHASAVRLPDGRCLAITGASGAGKSTTAALLVQVGLPLVADDVTFVDAAPDARAQVHPGARSMKLWSNTLEPLGLADDAGPFVREGIDKVYVPAGITVDPADVLPLEHLVVITEARSGEEPGVEPITGAQAAYVLRRNTYRPMYAEEMGFASRNLAAIATILDHTRVSVARRPAGLDATREFVRDVLIGEPARG